MTARPEILRIDDPGDARIAPYRDIRERDLVGRQGRFVAEGRTVLAVLASQRRYPIESLFVLENRLSGLSDIMENLPADTPVYVAGAAVMDAVAGFPMHRGVLAMGRRAPVGDAASLLAGLPERSIALCLAGISNHDNMGALFRNAAAFGATAVFLDAACCDPLYRKALRVSVGGVLKVPYASFASPEAMLGAVGDAGFDILALSPSGSEDVATIGGRRRAALVLGAEGHGLSPHILARYRSVRIPIASGFDSLNVATASAIALHRLFDGEAPSGCL